MTKFFYLDQNRQQKGPYAPEELKQKPVFKNTLVWTQGMPTWKAAGEVPELAFLFETANQVAETQQPELTRQPTRQSLPGKNLNIFLAILSFISRLIGFVTSLVLRNKNPRASQQAMYFALAGMVLGLFFLLFS